MARSGAIRRGLALGLAAGVGAALVRAARSRRKASTADTQPVWPPMPAALVHPPADPLVATDPPSVVGPGASIPGPVSEDDGTAALIAEAAVLEAEGITEGAEVDEQAVAAIRSAAPADETTAETDLGAIVLAEEAALEAERLEADRLELARLAGARARAEELEDADRAARDRERLEALARFAAQREEAESLLRQQEEREATAPGPEARRPMMVEDLEAEWADDLDDPPAADRREDHVFGLGRLETDIENPTDEPDETDHLETALPDRTDEPDHTGATPQDRTGEPDHVDVAVEDPLWPLDNADDLEPAAQLVDEDELSAPRLEPMVPDEAVADLEEEPAWGAADDTTAAPEPVGAGGPAIDVRVEAEAMSEMAASNPETWAAWVAANPVAWADWAKSQPEPEPERRPATASYWPTGGDDPDPIGEEAAADAEFEPVDEYEPAEQHDPEPAPSEGRDGEIDDDTDYETRPEDQAAVAGSDARWASRRVPASGVRRRPLMTGDFDDVLPEDLIGDDEDDQIPLVAMPPLRRSGRPRVPLKARRLPPAEDADVGGDGGEVSPSDAPGPMSASARTAITDGSKAGATPTRPRRSTVTKAATAEPAGGGVVRTGTTKRSPRSKMAVLWVEPVGDTCPSSHPVKAILSRGIFHVVGGQFYERTRPERCYRVPAAAEADGLRQAKR